MQQSIEREMVSLVAGAAEGIPPEKIMQATDRVCELLVTHEARGERLRLVLGKMLALAQDTKAYRPEFRSFEEYSQALADRQQISRAMMRECLRWVRRIPELDPDQAERIGSTNINLVVRAIAGAGEKRLPKLLEEAETTPITEFEAKLQQRGWLGRRDPSATSTVLISIRGPLTLLERWRRFIGEREPAEVLAELIRKRRAEKKKEEEVIEAA